MGRNNGGTGLLGCSLEYLSSSTIFDYSLFCFVGESGSWLVVLNFPKVHFSPGNRLVLGSLIIILLYIYINNLIINKVRRLYK